MATTDTLTVPTTPDLRALGSSLAGLEAMGGAKARQSISALDSAWNESNGSVIATARTMGQSYKKTLDDLANPAVKRIPTDDPRLMAYAIGLNDITDGREGKSAPIQDDATRAAQERGAMKRLARDETDETSMGTLIAISKSEIIREITQPSLKRESIKVRSGEAR